VATSTDCEQCYLDLERAHTFFERQDTYLACNDVQVRNQLTVRLNQWSHVVVCWCRGISILRLFRFVSLTSSTVYIYIYRPIRQFILQCTVSGPTMRDTQTRRYRPIHVVNASIEANRSVGMRFTQCNVCHSSMTCKLVAYLPTVLHNLMFTWIVCVCVGAVLFTLSVTLFDV